MTKRDIYKIWSICLVYAIIFTIITLLRNDSMKLWLDLLVNIGISLITSLALSIFIYYKYLKRIPDENKNAIDKLLNDRLGYETTNHNAQLQKSDSVRMELSHEHDRLETLIAKVNNTAVAIKTTEDVKREQYLTLKDDYKLIVDSVNKLSLIAEAMRTINADNEFLKTDQAKSAIIIQGLSDKLAQLENDKEGLIKKNAILKAEIARLRSKSAVSDRIIEKDDWDLEH